jgi:DNA-directed RNA polymerase specialized sigma24 family protein
MTSSGWSVILRAQGSGPEARAAMGTLIGRHQRTVLTLIRHRGFPPDQTAEDLKQAFFARMLEHDYVARLDRERGHFRAWLKTAVLRFVFNEWERWYRKVGRMPEQPADNDLVAADVAPYEPFDVAYAWEIYRPAFEALREEQRDPIRFDALKRFLFGPQLDVVPYDGVAVALGMTRTYVAASVCKLRLRQKELLAAAVAETLDVEHASPQGERAIKDEVALICRIVSDTPEPDRA